MTLLNEIEQLKKGSIIDEKTLMQIFKCGPRGGMRRSLRTNSLVLLSYNEDSFYKKVRKENGIWKYTGMGRSGDQSLDYLQNKTLLNSNEKGINLYLFTANGNEFTFIDQVFLAGQPETEKFPGEDGIIRDILVFPLIEVGVKMPAFEFLESDSMLNLKNILEYPQCSLSLNSVVPIAKLMNKRKIDTLTGPGGWYFTKEKFFNNPNTSSKYKNGYIDEIIKQDKEISMKIVFEGQNKYINPFYKMTLAFNNHELINTLSKNYNDNGFRIHQVSYRYPDREKIDVNFINNEIINIKEQGNPFVSVVIGPNGTGKSTILGNIQKIILDAINFSNSKNTQTLSKEIEYQLTYQIGEDLFEIRHYSGKTDNEYFKNYKPILPQKVLLPKKVIAVAFSINDRFTYNDQNEFSNGKYHYLGIKSSNNTAKVGETTKNLVLNIISSSQKDNFNKHLKTITDFIGVEPVFKIKYFAKDKNLKDVLTIENINKIQNKLMNRSLKVKENIRFFESEDIINTYNSLINDSMKNGLFDINSQEVSITFNFQNSEEYFKYYYEFNILWHLYEMKIFDDVKVYLKKEKFYKLEDASSGEAQYITTMINILSTIDKDSLVIIDEPETSLHPNWQYKYIYGIREIFHEFKSCHFLLATHSHFFIADLVPETSSITSLISSKTDKMNIKLHDQDTFGWSADDILYNIFNMKTSRNFYLEKDLRKLLSYISKGNKENNEEIMGIFKKLDRLSLRPNDPLIDVIENAREYLKYDTHGR